MGCGLVAVLALGVTAEPAAPPGRMPERVSIGGVPAGGKSRAEVEKALAEAAKRLLAYPVAVKHGKRSQRTTPAKLGATIDVAAAVDQALSLAAERETLIDRIRSRFAQRGAAGVPLPIRWSEEGIGAGLRRFSERIAAPPRNARLTKTGGKFEHTPPKPGRELDRAALLKSLAGAFDAAELRSKVAASLSEGGTRSAWLAAQSPLAVEATLREAPPRVRLEHLKPITARLSTFRTGLGSSSRNRVHNIQLACRAIDGTVLLPGDVFSYNETVGPRVARAGFKEAPQIVRGELQPGIGGGICQVSSTLYNAALLADLEIVRRRHHGIPVAYVSPGRDATVVDGAVDFRIKNNRRHPIALDAKIAGREVVFHVYGHPDDRAQVEIRSSRVTRVRAGVRTVPDSRLASGRRVFDKSATDGRRVTITRVVKKDGQVVREEVVSRDYYRPQDAVVRVGTRRAASRPRVRRAPAPETASRSASPQDAPEADAGTEE